MATKIRLQRHGRKSYAFYSIVIADVRAPRDGKFTEKIGTYNPNTNPATVDLKFDRALFWVENGAQPTDTVRNILSDEGVYLMKHLKGGVKKGAFDEAAAQKKFDAWKQDKQNGLDAVRAALAKAKKDEQSKKFEAEKAMNEAIAKKVAEKKAAAEAAEATIKELGDKNLNARQKKERAAAEAVVADFKATNDTLEIYKNNVVIMKDNIAASIEANDVAEAQGEGAAALANSVSNTIYWCYALFAIIIIIAVFSACADLFISFAQNWKKALIKLVVGVAILVVVYFIANAFVAGHGWHEGKVLKDAAGYDLGLGTDPATREVFGAKDYAIADFSLIICYIVAGAAILSAFISVIIGFFKK